MGGHLGRMRTWEIPRPGFIRRDISHRGARENSHPILSVERSPVSSPAGLTLQSWLSSVAPSKPPGSHWLMIMRAEALPSCVCPSHSHSEEPGPPICPLCVASFRITCARVSVLLATALWKEPCKIKPTVYERSILPLVYRFCSRGLF